MMSERHGERETWDDACVRACVCGLLVFYFLLYDYVMPEMERPTAVPGAHMYMGASSTT